MSKFAVLVLVALLVAATATARADRPTGDPEQGAKLFRACAMCHSLAPGRNMTGPSLAGVWQRKAGGSKSFARYSPAMKEAGVIWDEKTLDAWLKSPQGLIPHTSMTFPGIADARQRADLIAFLQQAAAGAGSSAGFSGKVRKAIDAYSAGFEDLKKLGPDRQVRVIQYCHAAYQVTTSDGETREFWEANLRFKTDSSDTGPAPGKPAIMPAGMGGDRASVFFSSPGEISTFIKPHC